MSRDHNFTSVKTCIVGRSGQGKSTFQRQMIRCWPADYKFVFDHKDEFKNLLPSHQCRGMDECVRALHGTKSVCFRSSLKPREGFEPWCEAVIEICKTIPGRKLFAFDECGLLVPRNAAKYEKHPLREIMETGREFGIDVLIAAQRPSHLCPDLRGQISKWVLFNTPAGWTKPLCDDYERDFSAVLQLNKGHFIAYDVDEDSFERGTAKPD